MLSPLKLVFVSLALTVLINASCSKESVQPQPSIVQSSLNGLWVAYELDMLDINSVFGLEAANAYSTFAPYVGSVQLKDSTFVPVFWISQGNYSLDSVGAGTYDINAATLKFKSNNWQIDFTLTKKEGDEMWLMHDYKTPGSNGKVVFKFHREID